jgi:hypothetical protein
MKRSISKETLEGLGILKAMREAETLPMQSYDCCPDCYRPNRNVKVTVATEYLHGKKWKVVAPFCAGNEKRPVAECPPYEDYEEAIMMDRWTAFRGLDYQQFDKGIRKFLKILHRFEIPTMHSCDGHGKKAGWISFVRSQDASCARVLLSKYSPRVTYKKRNSLVPVIYFVSIPKRFITP